VKKVLLNFKGKNENGEQNLSSKVVKQTENTNGQTLKYQSIYVENKYNTETGCSIMISA
jgi:hypothetical protein